MPKLIESPTLMEAAGTKPKLIDEYVGRASSGEAEVSVAHMRSPAGWSEPGQTPEFDEFTVVLRGCLRVEHRGGLLDVRPRSGCNRALRRVGALFDAGAGRGRIRGGMPAGVFTADGPSRARLIG